VCCYNRYHDNAVKGFWALWSNIYVCVVMTRFRDNTVNDFEACDIVLLPCVCSLL
jgi:hypothetical protein